MTDSFSVRTTPHYDRLAARLLRKHPALPQLLHEVISILTVDPYNRSGQHHIKKLKGVPPGEGQFRLRLQRWRFRYDVHGNEVVLHYCGLRSEETYR